MKTLDEKKVDAKKAYSEARKAYFADMNAANWKTFCDAKKSCMLLGVRI